MPGYLAESGRTYPVDIVFECLRQVGVDDEANAFDVQPS